MNIVFEAGESIHIQGMAATLVACEHNVTIWDKGRKSIYDMVHELEPEILFGFLETFNRYARFLDECSDSGLITDVLDLYGDGAMGRYANIAQYFCGKFNPKYECDKLYISDRPATELVVKSIQILSEHFKVRAIGDFPLPNPEYVGVATIENIADSIKSTKEIVGVDWNWCEDAKANKKEFTLLKSIKDNKIVIDKPNPNKVLFTYFDMMIGIFGDLGLESGHITNKRDEIYEKVNHG